MKRLMCRMFMKAYFKLQKGKPNICQENALRNEIMAQQYCKYFTTIKNN